MLTVEESQNVACDIITGKGLAYTEYVTYGAYTETGEVKGNDTLVYEFFFAEKYDVIAVANESKTEINLDQSL